MEERSTITNYYELFNELELLKFERNEKEIVLKRSMTSFLNSLERNLNFESIIQQIANDNQIKKNLLKIGLNISTNFLLKKFFPEKNNLNNTISTNLIQLLYPNK